MLILRSLELIIIRNDPEHISKKIEMEVHKKHIYNKVIKMVRTDTKTETVSNLYQRNTDPDWKGSGRGVRVVSTFQRGDEETGIWSTDFKQHYIDSLQRGFPAGILTFVKDYSGAMAYHDPWKVLDGGNRLRAIRDFMEDKFVNLKGTSFSQLSPMEQAEFRTTLIPVQEITIERSDPDDTITKMFIRLNTKMNALAQGELVKSHGHRGDIWEIELAKKVIGDIWTSNFDDSPYPVQVSDVRDDWSHAMGDIRENKRCNSLAFMVGFICSAKTAHFVDFECRYRHLSTVLSSAGSIPSKEEYDAVSRKLLKLCEICRQIKDKSLIGSTRGMPSKHKVAPLWKAICEEKYDDSDINKFVSFYNEIDTRGRDEYLRLFQGMNCQTKPAQMQAIVEYVLKAIPFPQNDTM